MKNMYVQTIHKNIKIYETHAQLKIATECIKK